MRAVLLLVVPVVLVVVIGGAALIGHARRADAGAVAGPSATPEVTYSILSFTDQRKADEARITTAIEAATAAQSTALLAGDEKTFAGFADPSAKSVAPWLRDAFTSLHAMGVARWNASVTDLSDYGDQRWHATVQVEYCFAADCPRPLTIDLSTMWNLADEQHPRLREIWPSTLGGSSLNPWAESVLTARSGTRVVVAAGPANKARLAGTVRAAEAAAKVADTYAAAAKPGKYLIYLADSEEWDLWSEGDEGKWVAGYATAENETVVVNVKALRSTNLTDLLRHEMTHVASLAGRSGSVKRADAWWLTEGLAEYAAEGKSFASYSRRAETAAFVRSGWNGDLRVGEPGKKASVRAASARYGTAYLGVSCLMTQYGRLKAMAFFDAVAVQGTSLTSAATDSLGTTWPKVRSTCAARIRGAA